MPVTPGSATKLNKITGVASVLALTTTDEENTALMAKVLAKNILVKFSNGTVAMTDGVKAVSALTPIIDQRLTTVEKLALTNTFSGDAGAYKATEGGFLVLGADGKFDAANMPASIFENGKMLLSALPDSVRAGVTVMATYDGLASATDEQKRGLIMVVDASGDTTVADGAAMYQWVSDQSKFIKIAEVESLDLDIAALTPDYGNVEAAGAVMYDHTLLMEAPTLTDLVAKQEAAA